MKYAIGLIATAALFFGGATSAEALDITSAAACCTFTEGPFTQSAGEIPNYVNPDDADSFHNVTSTDGGPDGGRLFESDTVFAGKTVPVDGAQYLSDGTYPFLCTIHGPSMSGDLIISGGTAVPRPKIAISFPFQKLKQVRKSGKVKVKVKAVTAASGIALEVTKGKQKLGSVSKLKIAKGATRTVAIKLTNKGRKAIKKGKKVVFSAKGTVPSGKSATARRALR